MQNVYIYKLYIYIIVVGIMCVYYVWHLIWIILRSSALNETTQISTQVGEYLPLNVFYLEKDATTKGYD